MPMRMGLFAESAGCETSIVGLFDIEASKGI
jgi:hypothetical protein